jgi:amino acid adenylation domain-containing protein
VSDIAKRIADLSPEKLKLLVRRTHQKSGNGSQAIIRPQKRETNALPLSFAQQRLWFFDQLELTPSTYNIPYALHLNGTLELAALERSFNEVMQRHEVLRTHFPTLDGQPVQRITNTLRLTIPLLDLSALSRIERETISRQLANQEAQRPFDLTTGPLVRVHLLRLGSDEHVLLLNLHHIICDGWSLGVLMRELAILYAAFVHGQPSPLAELPLQYADFTLWQRDLLQGEMLQEQLAYWRTHLAGAPTVLELPTDHPRPAVQSYRGAWHSFQLPLSLTEKLKALSQQEGVTLFMTLLAAFAILLARWSGQSQVVVGTPVAERGHRELEELIGFFVNTLALRVDLSGNPSVRELLARVREVALQGYAHQDLPFEKLVEVLTPERHLSHTPLFQVMLILQNTERPRLTLPGVTLQPFFVESGGARFDLTLSLDETEQGLAGVLEYSTDLFEPETMQRLVGHLQTLLEAIVQEPEQHVAELPLLTASECRQLLLDWNATKQEYQEGLCVHQLFEAQVQRTPDAVALVYEDEHLTYGELDRRANQLAHHLQTLGVEPDGLVGLCLPRSVELLVAMLAILKAGGAYVPLDPDYPPERLTFMLADAMVKVVLTQAPLLPHLPLGKGEVLCLDQMGSQLAAQPSQPPISQVRPEHLAYVIYTSGSTGRPKGVALPHLALTNLLSWHLGCLLPGARTLQFASMSFDASFHEIFAAWSSGGTVCMIPEMLRRDMPGLAHMLSEMAVEKAIFPVVVLQQLAQQYSASGSWPAHLQEITTTGEQLHLTPAILQWFQIRNFCRLHNHYGPSESHVVSSFTFGGPVANWPITPPIGRPIANTQFYVLDKLQQLVPIGVVGELYIGGVSLARGYLRRADLTAERFVPHPFSERGGERLYRTGDLARYLPDGNIEYLGRRDQQVKLRGYRIELGEIEEVLRQHEAVREAVVLLREDQPGDKRLVAYLMPSAQLELKISEIRSYLEKKLPDYMVPSAFVLVEFWPLNANGKVDRQRLPVPDHLRPELEVAYEAPLTPAEEVVAGIWADVLKLEQVGIHDNFFELGGHSLLAAQVVSRLCTAFQIQLPLLSLFEKPTVAGLVSELAHLWGGREVVEEIAQTLKELE